MSSPDAFYAVPASVFPVDQNQCLVLNRRDGTVRQVDALAARALGCCQGVRPLEAHFAAMFQGGVSANPEAVAKAAERLLTLELLRQWTFRPPVRATAPAPAEIDTIVVITADRPRMLARCLESIVRHCRRWGHAPRLLVVDGSRRESAATVEAICAVGKQAPGVVEYLGQDQAARIRHDLAVEGIPQDVLDFALTPGEIGANRNLALLSTIGERIIMVDDDIVWEPWELEGETGGVALAGHEDPREWRFFETRQEALDAARRVDVDLLAAHGAVLGQRLGDVLAAGEPDLRTACQHMIAAVEDPHSRTIRVTSAGRAGDLAGSPAFRFLVPNRSLWQALLADEHALRPALASRDIHHIARQLTITHHMTSVGYCMGLDNRTLLPPFLPTGRNEDAAFGSMLHLIDEGAVFAHLPYGVIHSSEPASPRPFENGPMASAQQPSLSAVVLGALGARSLGSAGGTQSRRLKRIGEVLHELAEREGVARLVGATELVLAAECRRLRNVGGQPSGKGPGPFGAALERYWRLAVARLTQVPWQEVTEQSGEGTGWLPSAVSRTADLIELWSALEIRLRTRVSVAN